MAALVCDLCGGKLVMGAGGVAVCDTCGMEHSQERMKEKIREGIMAEPAQVETVKFTQIDTSSTLENYFTLANKAKEAGNNAEAESYCNKIIELDPTNYNAWFLKGQAAGWQSTLQNNRIQESSTFFIEAISCAPEEEKEVIKEQAKTEMVALADAYISLRGDFFVEFPNAQGKNDFFNDCMSILDINTKFHTQTQASPGTALLDVMHVKLMTFAMRAFNQTVNPEFFNKYTGGKPSRYDWERYIEGINCCIAMLELAEMMYDGSGNDKYIDFQVFVYKDIIVLHENAIESHGWTRYYNTQLQMMDWCSDGQLSGADKASRKKKIAEYKAKLEILQQKKINLYWDEHADEKSALETEKEDLQKQIAELQAADENSPEKAEKDEIHERVRVLIAEKQSLGIFKGKEKKAIQEKIDAADLELMEITDKIEAAKKENQKKIKSLKKRVKDIDTELTKER